MEKRRAGREGFNSETPKGNFYAPMTRMWINQPSASQPLHDHHGVNVLVDTHKGFSGYSATVYFLDGETISALIPRAALSSGWR